MNRRFDVQNIRQALGKQPTMDELRDEAIGAEKPQIVEKTVEVVPDGAIVRREDGALVYKRFVMWPSAMEIPEGCDKPEWEDVGKIIKDIENSLSWWVGDFADYANKNLDMTYEQITEWLGGKYTLSTIETYASICRRVHGLIRNQAVDIAHHGVVAKMDDRLIRVWLEYAQVLQLKLAAFKREVALLEGDEYDQQMVWLDYGIRERVLFSELPEFEQEKPKPSEHWKTWKQSSGRIEKALSGDLELSWEEFQKAMSHYTQQAYAIWRQRHPQG